MFKSINKLLCLLFIISPVFAFSQTKIRGNVFDKKTKEPIPFATISVKGTYEGTVTDYQGNFFLEFNEKADTIIINCMGYFPDTLKISLNSFNNINIGLIQESFDLEKIVVYPGENPANILLNKVIQNKKSNDPSRLKTYSYEQYTKLRADMNNFDPRIKNEKFMKDFSVLFDGLDTSSVTGKVYVPLVLFESLSDFYFEKNPRNKKEIIKAIKTSGVQNESATQFSGQMYVELNFYDNYMNIFQKEFVSPISFSSLMVYKYYLIDSSFIDKSWCYHISYKPKRKNEYTFNGDMWIADTTFAIKKISATMSEDVNIEFISSMYIEHTFGLINDSIWFPNAEELFIDFNVTEKMTGFFGRKNVIRKNIKIDFDYPPKFFSKTQTREIIVNEDVLEHSEEFWNQNRFTDLSQKELGIYKMVDSITAMPKFQKIKSFVYLISTGYFDLGKFEFGPYFYMYSKNAIEGNRFRIGGRTSNDFSKKIEFSGHLAFGLLDQKLKYSAQSLIKLDSKPWTMLKFFYEYDMVQLGLSSGAFGSDNIFSSALSATPNDKLLPVSDFETGIERDIFSGFITNLYFSHRNIYPTDSLQFINYDDIIQNKLTVNEISLSLHFGYNEEFIAAHFNRLSMGSLFPILELNYTHGFAGFWGSEYSYDKLIFGLQHYAIFGPFGKLVYHIEAGKIFGKVPFPLLKLHEGNQTYFFDSYAFNMMNYYEFASDQYVSVFAEHHFQGLFFNKIPLLRKLHFREVIYAKGVIGSLQPENVQEFQFQNNLSDVRIPYIETGAGIENIFKVFRVDVVWRLTHVENPEISKVGFRFGMAVAF